MFLPNVPKTDITKFLENNIEKANRTLNNEIK